MISAYKSREGMEEVIRSYNELLKLWGAEYTEEDVPTTFGTTHCILAGNKEAAPLLLLHGVGDNSAVMWPFNIGELSRHYFCIAVDTIGGPGKSVPGENFTKEKFTQRQWLNEITAHFGLKRIHMAGVSNGGAMAFNYAVMEPEKVRKVVCLEGGMVTNPMKAMIGTLGMLFPEILIPTRKNMVKIIHKMASPNNDFYDKHPQIVDHVILLMRKHNRRAMFIHDIGKYDRDAAAKVRDKFLLLFGDSRMEKRKEFFDMLDKDGYKYKIITNAGHGVNHEQADEANREMISFLGD